MTERQSPPRDKRVDAGGPGGATHPRTSRRAILAGIATGVAGCVAPQGVGRAVTCPATVGSDAGARIGLVGDVMLGRNVNDRWGDPETDPGGVWDGLTPRLQGLDGLVCNLECAISTRGSPRDRTYTFRADPAWAVPALRAGNVTVASLANNHVLDFGRPAFADTRDHLARADVAATGAGATLEAALAPAVVEMGGCRVAVFGMTDRYPVYAAGPETPGTVFAALQARDPRTETLLDRIFSRVRAAEPDIVIATLHWGPNWVVRPSAAQQRFARHLIDRGVDVVHGHSAHVIQGIETYRGRPIVYDAGDFVDDYAVKPDLHNDRSLLVELEIEAGRFRALALHPVRIVRERVRPASGSVAAWIRSRVRRLSQSFDTTVDRSGNGLRIPLDSC